MIKLRTALLLSAALTLAGQAARAATFTTLADFQAAVPHAGLIEDFETRGPTNTQLLQVLGTNEIFKTLIPGSHDLIVTANNHAFFDIPGTHTTSRVLTSFASEDFRDTFTTADHQHSAPVHAVGFDVLLTSTHATTIRFFSDALAKTTIQTLTLNPSSDLANNLQFVGFTSDGDIAGFDFVTNGVGDDHNSGIDNIRALPSGELLPVVKPPVSGAPEPATWALMLFGFGAAGAALRRRRRAVA